MNGPIPGPVRQRADAREMNEGAAFWPPPAVSRGDRAQGGGRRGSTAPFRHQAASYTYKIATE